MDSKEEATIAIYDIMGRQAHLKMVPFVYGNYHYKIHLDEFKAGIYFMNIQKGLQSYKQKLIVY